jgi:hypothetical protein
MEPGRQMHKLSVKTSGSKDPDFSLCAERVSSIAANTLDGLVAHDTP